MDLDQRAAKAKADLAEAWTAALGVTVYVHGVAWSGGGTALVDVCLSCDGDPPGTERFLKVPCSVLNDGGVSIYREDVVAVLGGALTPALLAEAKPGKGACG